MRKPGSFLNENKTRRFCNDTENYSFSKIHFYKLQTVY